jgi:hypothetical protein
VKSIAEKLLDVTDAFGDRQVAAMIADKMTQAEREPYRFKINHDTRGPAFKRCPIEYDWTLKDVVGIERRNKAQARLWITNAALNGYQITEVDAKKKDQGSRTESIAIVRRRAMYHQQPKSDDDDIPF